VATNNQVNVGLSGASGTGSFAGTTSPTFVTPVLGAGSATSLSFSSTSGIIGTTTNNDAAAGSVGEFVSSVIAAASAVSVTSTTIKDITSISLTAGDWNVWGNVVFLFATATNYTALISWVSSTSVTQPDASLITDFSNSGNAPGNGSAISCNTLMRRFSLSGTTTIYVSSQQVFTGGTMTACGGIYARRIR